MSQDTMSQYRDLYVQTSKEYLATLNEKLLVLEHKADDKEAIDAIFRAAHSLKGQSAAMGFEQTGYLCHVIEDAFYNIREQHEAIKTELADALFKAFDALSGSINKIEADGSELQLSDIADQLKTMNGLHTQGSGHTSHSDVEPITEAPTISDSSEPDVSTGENTSDHAWAIGQSSSQTRSIKTVPVRVERLDEIVGTLEELMVNRLTMQALVREANSPQLTQVQDKVNELIELVQYQIMKIRTVPLNVVLDHFPRSVRDLARSLNKHIELRIIGGDLELDRTIVERLDEPLTHLLRNAADHGINESGVITIRAHAQRDFAVVSVEDNGGGIDWGAIANKAQIDPHDSVAIKKALFSGISTSREVTLVSGRGVGLETVKKTVEDMSGLIEVASSDKGTIFSLKLPLALSVIRTLIVQVGKQRYAIAATAIDRSIRLENKEIVKSINQEAFRFNDTEVPLIRLRTAFSSNTANNKIPEVTYAVIINADSEKIAFAVDAVKETVETVIRPLPRLLKDSHMFSGVAVVGDGTSVLLINPRGFSNAE